VTSAGSSELIAVSSLCTYDIYRTYINPKANGKQILIVSRSVVFLFGCFMGVLAILLNKAGVSLGWMYLAMGVFIGSAVMPVAFLLLWNKANAKGAMTGAIAGMLLGITTWLVVTKVEYGRVTLDTTGRNAPMLAGNLVSILSGGAIHAIMSYLSPQNYDWVSTRHITMVDRANIDVPEEEFNETKLKHARTWIIRWGIAFTILIAIIWPIFALPAKVFSEGYFAFWASIAIIWGTVGSLVIILLPLYESRETIRFILSGMFTNEILYDKIDDISTRVRLIMKSMPEAERLYYQEKEQHKKDEASESIEKEIEKETENDKPIH
jgi:Na+/proline symporter